jgi:RNA polymerase sigma factor (sigma-70 family)
MLGSQEEAEDAVQHTFAAAFNDLQRNGDRKIILKPWLYTIARNRCLSVLRARREQTSELMELPTEGLQEQVARRAELRDLLADLRELPEEQRAALLLAEAADLSHAEVAGVLGCEVARVKALVFRARSGLIERRDARETPCADIREQLANLRGGSLRRSELRHHLRHCPGCSDYREQVRQQRQMLAVALPVVPSLGLKSSVLSAAGLGGGGAGGAAAVAAGGGVLSSLGSAAVAKVALVTVLAGGGLVAGGAAVRQAVGPDNAPPSTAAPTAIDHAGEAGAQAGNRSQGELRGERMNEERSYGRRGAERREARSRGVGTGAKARPDRAAGRGNAKNLDRQKPLQSGGRGRADIVERGSSNGSGSKAPAERTAPQAKPQTEAAPPPPDGETLVVPEDAPLLAPRSSAPGRLKLQQ